MSERIKFLQALVSEYVDSKLTPPRFGDLSHSENEYVQTQWTRLIKAKMSEAERDDVGIFV